MKRTEYSQIKVEDLQPLIDDFEKAVDGFEGQRLRKNPLSSLYVSSCDDFLKAAKELMRRVRDKTPFSEFEQKAIRHVGGLDG